MTYSKQVDADEELTAESSMTDGDAPEQPSLLRYIGFPPEEPMVVDESAPLDSGTSVATVAQNPGSVMPAPNADLGVALENFNYLVARGIQKSRIRGNQFQYHHGIETELMQYDSSVVFGM